MGTLLRHKELTMTSEYAREVMLFGRWSYEDVEVQDISLQDYIAAGRKYAQFLPHTAGRYQKKRFRKASCPIVERLAVCMMHKGRNNGKKMMAMRIVKHAFEIIHLLTDQNPVQVFVEAGSTAARVRTPPGWVVAALCAARRAMSPL